MQWIIQDFEDTRKLGQILAELGRDVSWHKVVPFVGELTPEPVIRNPKSVLLFGAYSLWKYADSHDLFPGVFRIAPFLYEDVWRPYLLNGSEALVMPLSDCVERLAPSECMWFLRPVEDSKEVPGRVLPAAEIVALAQRVTQLSLEELPIGSLRPDTEIMLSAPQAIEAEWRLWIVAGQVVSYSRYKQAGKVAYVQDIPLDALAFAQKMVALNPDYSAAYVMDICQTADGFCIIETNCINAAGFYAADIKAIVAALEARFDQG
ncbi:ATP-grasp domain-containing protein [Shimia marina]|uniref:ATP-grasp domain-containing protein n=1 Tax=Shimia marina TaxID=321267 RepID=A0A0P1ESV0_9RHOB|nr:ATP-grasp domain-containing protein [Shimia marina]CUH53259.1 hypothetical protein SHM7688_02712 [Shimia marina]SFD81335.1 protein of unknown function [Shimia marina]